MELLPKSILLIAAFGLLSGCSSAPPESGEAERNTARVVSWNNPYDGDIQVELAAKRYDTNEPLDTDTLTLAPGRNEANPDRWAWENRNLEVDCRSFGRNAEYVYVGPKTHVLQFRGDSIAECAALDLHLEIGTEQTHTSFHLSVVSAG